MSRPGSLAHRARLAVGAALQAGWTRLAALVLGELAAYGPKYSWKTDRAHSEQIVQRNGKHPHPGSIGRVRRAMAAAGVIKAKRIYAGQKFTKEFSGTSAHGVVRCQVLWERLGVVDPVRAIAARHTAAAEREPRPRHIATAGADPAAMAEFEALAKDAVDTEQRRESHREQRADARTFEGIARRRPRPPD